MNAAVSRPLVLPQPVCPVRLAAAGDSPVASPVAAHLARLDLELSAPAKSAPAKYSRRSRAVALIVGAAGSWGLVIAGVAIAVHAIGLTD